ncbi:MAG: leucyl aminopeptidase [Actinobacteria bacterium]|nr:leucyl aminopeptidase [Actinomycetota bacterium]
MTAVRLAALEAKGSGFDALIVGVSTNKRESKLEIAASTGLGHAERKRIVAGLLQVGATPKAGAVTKLPAVTGIDAQLLICVVIGATEEEATLEQIRQAAGAGTLATNSAAKIAVVMPGNSPAEVAAAAQGALLGAYRFESFRGVGTKKPAKAPATITLLTDAFEDRHVREAVRQAEIVANEVWFARDLVNAPPSALHPQELAEAAVAQVAGLDVETEVLDEAALKEGKYGGILAVGQGSVNPPRLVRLSYRPATSTIHIALVGKGITFDSGGLSLKPPTSMETMKCDMGGAAAVLAATAAIARLGLPAAVTTYAACAENMPSGTAQRPGDVLTTLGGTTVEVLNTDAEGRLVLADALVRAGQDKPDVIIDVATLTGAQMVALGNRVSAVMSNSDDLRDDVVRSAEMVGEQFWPMPLPPELRESLDSPIADLANIGDRMGGMLTAGLFLQEFVDEETPWAHLDIAGPAFNDTKPHDYTPKGGTGVAVRTLVQLVKDLADAASE